MMRSEIVALTFAAFCVLLIVLIVFASKNKKLKLLAKLNTKNQEIILRNFGFIYWVYMLLINFANVALIFYLPSRSFAFSRSLRDTQKSSGISPKKIIGTNVRK